MNNLERSNQRQIRKAVFGFAVVFALVVGAAFAATMHGVDTRVAENHISPGTIGLAHPHPPLDRAPGESVRN